MRRRREGEEEDMAEAEEDKETRASGDWEGRYW
jgi:hypothetical protein